MQNISALVERTLKEKLEFKFRVNEENNTFLFSFNGINGRYECFIRVEKELEYVLCSTALSTYIPEHRRQAAADLICRINYALIMGCFELDMRDGEVRFRTSAYSDDEGINEACLARLITVNLATIDRHLPAILAISFSDKTPQQVMASIENGDYDFKLPNPNQVSHPDISHSPKPDSYDHDEDN